VAAETARVGGTLTFAVGAKAPSYDGHRETTFAAIHPLAPHYSTLLRFDPENYPKIVGDVAESWTISGDGLTYTFKIRPGIKFHDGSLLTAQDVKATYEHIIFPPERVVSPRKASYAEVEKVEAPNDGTVIFRLKWPSAALLANLASPWEFIYKAELLAKDPHWYETHVMAPSASNRSLRRHTCRTLTPRAVATSRPITRPATRALSNPTRGASF
jgi:peptide/nickel transport system substrate-binding protein